MTLVCCPPSQTRIVHVTIGHTHGLADSDEHLSAPHAGTLAIIFLFYHRTWISGYTLKSARGVNLSEGMREYILVKDTR